MENLFQVRNLGRGRGSRTQRVLRPGRRTGFILGDGTRIRKKGRRSTELDTDAVAKNLDHLIQGLEEAYISITLDEKPLTADELRSIITGKKPKKPKEAPAKVEETDSAGEHSAVFLTESSLKKMSRVDLDELAEEWGLDPEDYSRKGDLAEVLFDTMTEED